MAGSSYKVATILGIPIRIHISLVLMVLIFIARFGWAAGLLLEAGLAGSIILHELGHSVVARRKGCRVREITLMFIGGAAQMERMPTRPRDEFLMAVAGPAVSVAIGLTCVSVGQRLALPLLGTYPLNLVEMLGWINFALVIFNLLPAFPMDGGRVVRAALTPKLGRLKATLVAARIGKVMAIVFGIYGFMVQHWILVAIAFFVYIAAGNEYRIVEMQEADRRGAGPWSRPAPEGDPSFQDQVIIGPPPYEKGRGSVSAIRPADQEDWDENDTRDA